MTGNLISRQCTAPFHHLILQEEEMGAYLFIFEQQDSPFPERDYWFENRTEAMAAAKNDFEVVDWLPTALRY